ncbi:MAG: glycine oxidase ThiO [Cyanobacteria bacterium P01_D01_bin.36]
MLSTMGQAADVIIVGGGVMGLAIALELHQQGTQVTVLSKDFSAAAGHAAAGMLAPSAEQLPSGPMATLCQRSLDLYPTWVSKLEDFTGQDSGYWPCGILAPQLQSTPGSLAHDVSPQPHVSAAQHLSATAIHSYQPGLSPSITGGYFYPEDAQVDNRALLQALRSGAQDLGITLQSGVSVEGFIQKQNRVIGLRTSAGEKRAGHYVLATGAWSGELLPVPVTPRKGQMASVRVPPGSGNVQPLRRVLYGEHIYIVPRRDGRIIIGATVEDVGFTPNNTPAGITQILKDAIALYPALATFPIEEIWWGYRPATPDELPILGPGPCKNLTLATGHYRNGVLLAPATALLVKEHLLAGLA